EVTVGLRVAGNPSGRSALVVSEIEPAGDEAVSLTVAPGAVELASNDNAASGGQGASGAPVSAAKPLPAATPGGVSEPASTATTVDVAPIVEKPAVVGHLLERGTFSAVTLSDNAVDVLLYEGGQAVVQNFNVGQDRLWLFLPNAATAPVTYFFANATDLVMDFGSG